LVCTGFEKSLKRYTFLVTKSLLRQRAQIFMVTVEPSISVFTFFRFGFQTRRVRFLAWLTELPVTVCFPQISQVRDIQSFLANKKYWKLQYNETKK
jgi:hypothetical protein